MSLFPHLRPSRPRRGSRCAPGSSGILTDSGVFLAHPNNSPAFYKLFLPGGPPVLAPNLCLPVPAPNLYLPALAPNLCLPALPPQFGFTGPGPQFVFNSLICYLPVQVKIFPLLRSYLYYHYHYHHHHHHHYYY